MWSAACDPRLKAAVVSGWMCTTEGVFAVPNCECWELPGFVELMDVCEVHLLIAPRPLLFESAEQDGCFPIAVHAAGIRAGAGRLPRLRCGSERAPGRLARRPRMAWRKGLSVHGPSARRPRGGVRVRVLSQDTGVSVMTRVSVSATAVIYSMSMSLLLASGPAAASPAEERHVSWTLPNAHDVALGGPLGEAYQRSVNRLSLDPYRSVEYLRSDLSSKCSDRSRTTAVTSPAGSWRSPASRHLPARWCRRHIAPAVRKCVPFPAGRRTFWTRYRLEPTART